MLPEKLSNGLCSLKPEVDRLVMCGDCVVTNKGALDAYQFYRRNAFACTPDLHRSVGALSAPDSKEAQRGQRAAAHLPESVRAL